MPETEALQNKHGCGKFGTSSEFFWQIFLSTWNSTWSTLGVSWFAQALMVGLKQYSFEPSLESYGSLLNACAKAQLLWLQWYGTVAPEISFFLSQWRFGTWKKTTFQHCATYIWTILNSNDFWNLIKQEMSGSLLVRVDVHDMKACHYAMVCGLQGSDAASAMQVLQRMEQIQLSANQVCFSTATRKQREAIFLTDTDTRQRVWLNSF